MNNYGISIEVPEGRIKEIFDRLTKAQEEIYACYTELAGLGVVKITEKDDSGS